jgi:hypothetical protein
VSVVLIASAGTCSQVVTTLRGEVLEIGLYLKLTVVDAMWKATRRAVESVHKTSSPNSDFFIKSQYVLIKINL